MAHLLLPPTPPPSQHTLWRVSQWLGIVATAALLLGLLVTPELVLRLLWDVTVPLVPASLLIAPGLWRNVCPLATLTMLPNGVLGRRRVSGRVLAAPWLVGIGLLFLLVPARRFLFNADGTALAATIAAVGLIALAAGACYDAKAGFCNTICPILPVERLYGQRPLLQLGNARCDRCSRCAVPGCLDMQPTRAAAQALGRARHSHAWLRTGFGVFTAGFPGFVIGYYTLADTSLAAAGEVYLHVAAWTAGAYVVAGIVVLALDLPAWRAMPVLGATAAGAYYWFAAPRLAEGLAVSAGATVLRVCFLGLVGVWLLRAALPPSRTSRSS